MLEEGLFVLRTDTILELSFINARRYACLLTAALGVVIATAVLVKIVHVVPPWLSVAVVRTSLVDAMLQVSRPKHLDATQS